MRALVVEDEAALREALRRDLAAKDSRSTLPPMARRACSRH